jgi:hypothetical protein
MKYINEIEGINMKYINEIEKIRRVRKNEELLIIIASLQSEKEFVIRETNLGKALIEALYIANDIEGNYSWGEVRGNTANSDINALYSLRHAPVHVILKTTGLVFNFQAREYSLCKRFEGNYIYRTTNSKIIDLFFKYIEAEEEGSMREYGFVDTLTTLSETRAILDNMKAKCISNKKED